MGRGLLSRIEARSRSESRPSEDMAEVVAAHLRVLFNTHRGDAATSSSFGLVDFTDLVHTLPSSLPLLQASIRATILEFEPRLKNVIIRHLPERESPPLHFEITAQLAESAGGTLRFRTEVAPGGKVQVWS